jgi:hypothetical protein
MPMAGRLLGTGGNTQAACYIVEVIHFSGEEAV